MKTNFIAMKEADVYATRAGWLNRDLAATAIAICWAESGGNTLAVNINVANPLSPSYRSMDLGLCQFNTYWNPKFPIAQMFDPELSLKRMFELHDHYGFGLWTCYNNGRYEKYMVAATAATH
jgi:Lysozyme like domain